MTDPTDQSRAVLPIPDRQHLGLVTYDAKDPDTEFPPITPLLPPAGAPNVLVVLLDDVGYGASSAFGGPADTPTAERLQSNGLTYTRFHTTALCAPTRAALLSGRNHHSVGMGSITETATSAPGLSGLRPNTKAALPMTLKLNGYSTAQFGKCHEVPPWQTSPVGPFTSWPTGEGGFEHFYGFIGGENNQYYPALYEASRLSSRTRHRRRVTTSLRTLPITRSTGFGCRSHWLRTSRSSSTLHPAPHMHRTMFRSSGPTSTRAGSQEVGTLNANQFSSSRNSGGGRSRGCGPHPASRGHPGVGGHE